LKSVRTISFTDSRGGLREFSRPAPSNRGDDAVAIADPTTQDVLLTRKGLVFVEPGGRHANDTHAKVVEVALAELGYALSTRLSTALARRSVPEIRELGSRTRAALSEHLGSNRKHRPLFRKFPRPLPSSTRELWIRKVLCYFLQGWDQSCLFCREIGTTHVLDPCLHVVCDRCFDGENYSACPVCECHVDRSSPFFKPTRRQQKSVLAKPGRLRLLDLGTDLDAEASAFVQSLLSRRQALSPDDRTALHAILRDYGRDALPWFPEEIPLRENVAAAFGTLMRSCGHERILDAWRPRMSTATDVLRLIAAFSGADPALQWETKYVEALRADPHARWWGALAKRLDVDAPRRVMTVAVPVKARRFEVARMPRALRRALLACLEDLDRERLIEAMLRHRSYWVWVGEFLHPHEYAKRFPKVAAAFKVVRKRAPDGTPAPAFRGFYGKVEAAARAGDVRSMLEILRPRPGELARRFDHLLRLAGDDEGSVRRVLDAFGSSIRDYATPVLLTLLTHLPVRTAKAKVRIYWPKGLVAKGVSAPDDRDTLAPEVVGEAVRSIRSELLRRFAMKPRFDEFVIDAALTEIAAPFNERTASPAAVSLPRGSRVAVPEGRTVRLFLHWCQPETGGRRTDLDLSVGFYDSAWNYVGVCSYYQLEMSVGPGAPIAVSAGDLQDAPWPEGASEFIDLDRSRAMGKGIRYAVMVVNSFAGMPFGQLDRAFAGLMLRDDVGGEHFDPRTVELKFALQGYRGAYLPMALDLRENTLHWLDTYSRGEFAYNNVETSNSDIRRICPEMIEYFGSGTRASMADLALLHAAARGRRVHLRGRRDGVVKRQPDETAEAFHGRLTEALAGAGAETEDLSFDGPVFAALHRGDLDLPEGSECYALFRERGSPTLAASDLLS
jgi:hypothetical protein